MSAVNCHLFTSVALGVDRVTISHLQYADDTLLIGEASVDNLWAIRTVLRTYELSSGLRVNFAKSSLVGANMSDDFFCLGCQILRLQEGCASFQIYWAPSRGKLLGPQLGIVSFK